MGLIHSEWHLSTDNRDLSTNPVSGQQSSACCQSPNVGSLIHQKGPGSPKTGWGLLTYTSRNAPTVANCSRTFHISKEPRQKRWLFASTPEASSPRALHRNKALGRWNPCVTKSAFFTPKTSFAR